MDPSKAPETPKSISPPRLEYLRVRNFRALKEVEIKDLTPLTVLLGPNGSGKTTLFDVFQFLSECFQTGLRSAWDRRGRARELKTRGQNGPIEIDLKYREKPKTPLITYHLAIDEGGKGPVVEEEWLQWKRKPYGAPFRFLHYSRGQGEAASGEMPDEEDERVSTPLRSPDLIAVNTLGQFADHPRVAALREFITDWFVSYLTIEETRNRPEAGLALFPQRPQAAGSVHPLSRRAWVHPSRASDGYPRYSGIHRRRCLARAPLAGGKIRCR